MKPGQPRIKPPLLAGLLLAASLLIFACSALSGPLQEIVRTVEVVVDVEVTATPGRSNEGGTAAAPDAEAPDPTPTPNALQSTLEAMMGDVQPPGGAGSTRAPAIAPDDYVGMFEQAWRIVDENYVRGDFNGVDWEAVRAEYRPQAEAVSSPEEFWSLMEAFIGELGDDHSRFVRPDRFSSEFNLPSQNPGRPWPGLTVWPAREDEHLFIWDVCELGPAAEAGLRRGDVILAINGEPIERGEEGFDFEAIQQAFYGEEAGEVTLTVQQGPQADPQDVRIEYGGASGCDGWAYGTLSENPYIGYLRIADFGGDADTMILEAIERMEAERPLEGLVLDVRHNPGGNSDASIAIFTQGLFGKTGPLRDDATQTLYRIRGPVRWSETVPAAVLTDGSSHSAAEYFATAMQQSGRAVIVGMPTAGNTEGITGFSLPDGSLIRLAVMTLQLPDGSTIEETGVIPDISIPLEMWGLRQTPDVQLEGAYQAVLDQIP